MLKLTAPLCLSGGAEGADLQFGMCAGSAGHSVIHWSYAGHRTQAPASEVVILTPEMLAAADPFLIKANETLKRRVPFDKPWIANLLRRNLYQIMDAEAVYAVSTINKGQVAGGTAWATQMFVDRFHQQPCPCYVFDQQKGTWNAWEGHWQEIQAPPPPTGVYAGIGSRELLPAGKQAIRDLLGYVH